LRWPAQLALSPMFRQKRRVLRGAFAISGITDEFLEWGLQGAGRGPSDLDFVAHHSYSRTEYRREDLATAATAWDKAGLREDRNLLTICYFGVLASSTDFEPVISGLRLLGPRAARVRLVICGDGYNLEHLRRSAADLGNVHFAGYVSGARITTLMERSDLGLAPYVATRNYLANIPGKVSEYLSSGLPLLSGIGGATGSYLQSNRCGWQYAGAEGFAERIAEFLDRPETFQAASMQAKEAFERDFPAEKIVAQVELSLERIARRWNANSASARARQA
jgi:glycosyltransferase involved in cell wall biosynthesis